MKQTLILAALVLGPAWTLSARAHPCPMQGTVASREPAAHARCAHHSTMSGASAGSELSCESVAHPLCAHHAAASGPSGGAQAPASPPAGMPRLPGQDAFGAIQEIVGVLEADPATDWSKGATWR